MIYRALENLPPRPNHTEPAALKHQLLFPWASTHGKPVPDHVAVTTRPDGYGGHISAPVQLLEPVTQPKWTELEQLTHYYLAGREQFPVITPDETPGKVASTLDSIACGGGLVSMSDVSRVKLPGHEHAIWARAFLSKTQGGKFDGTGLLLLWVSHRGATVPRTARFEICQHDFAMGAGANPSRGWRPGRCTKCGLDMSVDSGD